MFTRIICASAALVALAHAAIAAIVGISASTTVAIPGWSSLTGLLLVVLLQVVTFTLSLIFVILGSHQRAGVIPLRDYGYYVAAAIGPQGPIELTIGFCTANRTRTPSYVVAHMPIASIIGKSTAS